MRSATIIRAFFLTALLAGATYTATAQVAPRTSAPAPTTKTGGGTTQQAPAPVNKPSTDVPATRPTPNDQTTQTPAPRNPAPTTPQTKAPAPIYVPDNSQTTTRPAPQQHTTIDRNYDVNGDGVISKDERKRMKEIQKAEKKRARELRKAQHRDWVEDHKREMAAQGLEARQQQLKAHGKEAHENEQGNGHGNGHGKGRGKNK